MKPFPQFVIIPRLEPIEKAARGGQGGSSIDSCLFRVPEDNETTEQLEELQFARDVLHEGPAS